MAGDEIGKRMGACAVCPACAIPAKCVTDTILRCPHCFREGHYSTFEIGPWYSTRAFFERVEKATARRLERLRDWINKEVCHGPPLYF